MGMGESSEQGVIFVMAVAMVVFVRLGERGSVVFTCVCWVLTLTNLRCVVVGVGVDWYRDVDVVVEECLFLVNPNVDDVMLVAA